MTPTARLVQIQAWSYSRLQTYTQCPRRAKYLYVDKLKEPEDKAPALVKGSRVHALAALHTTRRLPRWDRDSLPFKEELERALKTKTIPEELSTFAEEFKVMIKAKAACETQWTFDAAWNFIEGKDAWFSPRAWLRVKVDAHYIVKKTLYIVDHKTGKMSPDHVLQRSLYALAGMIVYPDVERVRAAHWYLEPGLEEKDEWRGEQLPALRAEWTRRTTAMLSDTSFAPNPTDKCRWCHFRHANAANGGGQCEY